MADYTAERPLPHLVAQAVRLGGGNLCADGHDFVFSGGRACRNQDEHGEMCSEAVYECTRCGEVTYDYRGCSHG